MMATILEFPNQASITVEHRGDSYTAVQHAGEIILFPGVRRERTLSATSSTEKRKTNGK